MSSRSEGIISIRESPPLKPECIFFITSTIEYDFVTISSQGGASDFGEALTDHMGGATFNSSTRGFRAGGSAPSLSTPCAMSGDCWCNKFNISNSFQ